jgi:hypothetical protein
MATPGNTSTLTTIAAAVSAALVLGALAVAASASAGAAGESRASTEALGPDSMLGFGADGVLGFGPGSGAERTGRPSSGSADARAAIRRSGVLGGDSARGHGFVRDAHGFTTIDAPGASVTTATGRDNRGRVVGAYRDARRRVHGFLRGKHGFKRIDFPGAKGTVVSKINLEARWSGATPTTATRPPRFSSTFPC